MTGRVADIFARCERCGATVACTCDTKQVADATEHRTAKVTVYRVGLGRDLMHLRQALRHGHPRGHLGRLGAARARLGWMRRSLNRRSWWGLWQAEWPGCKHAVRGLTQRGTERKARRYLERHHG